MRTDYDVFIGIDVGKSFHHAIALTPGSQARLIDRRVMTGVEREAATRFVDFSDMPNVRLCLERTMPADVRLSIDADGDYRAEGIE